MMRMLLLATCVLQLAIGNSPALADVPAIYQPAGAPADPKVPARWNLYHDYPASTELLKQLAAAHPDLCKLESLGTSHGGREMWVMTIGNPKAGELADRPAMWIDGGIHANEIQATEVVLYTAWYLLESFDRSPFVTRLLNERTFHLMPMMSPDSRDLHMHSAATTHTPRSGTRPVDDDGDRLIDEDKPDDLDGDGSITQMRVADPNGRYKKHPEYPELMIAAKPDEKGEFTLIDSEGIDNDGDGRVDEDSDGYYDPNRNWPWNWQPQYVQNGAHHYPFSVQEVRLVGDYLSRHPRLAAAQSYHNAGGMILRGPGAKNDRYEASDTELLKRIASKGEELLPGYRSLEVASELYEMHGGEIDWLYACLGMTAFTNELFTGYNFFHQKEGGFFGSPETAQRFNRYVLFGDGIARWHAVDHPQFGKIEVGGLRKTWLRQPPSFLLEEECHRNMAFTLYHAEQMPRVVVDAVTIKKLPGDLHEVTATIANERSQPTRLAVDLRNRISPPDRVTITGDNLKVLAGFTSESPLFTEPQEQKRNADELELSSIPGMSARYVRWIVSGAKDVTVKVRSTKGGLAEKSLELGGNGEGKSG